MPEASTYLDDPSVSLVPELEKDEILVIQVAREVVVKNGRIKGVGRIDLKPSQ